MKACAGGVLTCLACASDLHASVLTAPGMRFAWMASPTSAYSKPRALASLVCMLESPDRLALKAAFDTFDSNGDGVVSLSEIDAALIACGSLLFEDEIEAVVGNIEDGISFEDFCLLAEERPETSSFASKEIRKAIYHSFPTARAGQAASTRENGAAGPTAAGARGAGDARDGFSMFFDLFQEATAAFDAFDEDGDGTITHAECAKTLRALGHAPSDADLKAMIDVYDENHNGALDFDEFCALLTDRVCPPGVDADLIATVSRAARNVVRLPRAGAASCANVGNDESRQVASV